MGLKKAIIKTLKYSSIFNYPLTVNEIFKYLITIKSYDLAQIKQELQRLSTQNTIYTYNSLYSYKKIDKRHFNNKTKSLKNFKLVKKQTQKDLSFLTKLFFIKFIGLTGSVAAKDLSGFYDIDLFFITQKNFVWITRLVVVIFLKLKRVYKNPYCPNIYISEVSLNWYLKNVYIANEIARLKIVYNKNNTFQKFLQKNIWITNYLANMRFFISKKRFFYTSSIISLLAFPLEYTFYLIEYLYMKPKISTEQVSLTKIIFLKKDYKNKILNTYKRLK